MLSSRWQIRLITLFSYSHRVSIDTENELVKIDTTYLYFIHSSRDLQFSHLWYIEYELETLKGNDSTNDYYIISLVDRKEEKYKICEIPGQETTNLVFGAQMTLGGDSGPRSMVSLLSETIGIPIGRPIGESMPKWTCGGCGREISANAAKCLYCGAVRPAGK